MIRADSVFAQNLPICCGLVTREFRSLQIPAAAPVFGAVSATSGYCFPVALSVLNVVTKAAPKLFSS